MLSSMRLRLLVLRTCRCLRRRHASGRRLSGRGTRVKVPPARAVSARRRQAAKEGRQMSILVIGGSGFIGHRLVRLLAARGQTVTSMDANPGAHSFADLG